jgi:hypothetical protein
MTINLIEAIVALDENARVSVNETTKQIVWHCGNQKNLSEEAIQAKLTELQADYDALQYQRDRASQYPSIQDQLDMQYHDSVNGTTTWKDAVAKVKADNPKP